MRQGYDRTSRTEHDLHQASLVSLGKPAPSSDELLEEKKGVGLESTLLCETWLNQQKLCPLLDGWTMTRLDHRHLDVNVVVREEVENVIRFC